MRRRLDRNRAFSANAILRAFQPRAGERNVGKGMDGADVRPQLTPRNECAQLVELALGSVS
ncbi:hypothetical protein GQ57_02225 [Burkholderia sp. MSh2]|nr:hypothetical protein GQ57_02225 [Burkholderia sp. MSh2]